MDDAERAILLESAIKALADENLGHIEERPPRNLKQNQGRPHARY
jgi:hypothetical protein